MRSTVSQRWTLVALCVLSVALLGWTPPAGAQISIGTLTTTTTTLEGTGSLTGTPDALEASAPADTIPSLLTADVLHATAIGYIDEVDSEASIADLALGVAGNTIGADFVMAQATSVLNSAPTSYAEVANLSINGVTVAITGAPNQTVAIPGGRVVINEVQTAPDGVGTVVNALHVTVLGIADVIVARATADAQTVTGQASAVQAIY